MIVAEGKAKIEAGEGVFYNPKMTGLRDISVAFLNAVGCKGKSLVDATAATGIRAIRYYKECGIKEITAIDINETAYKSCRKNISKNKVKAIALNKSVQEFASTAGERFDIVDLDPFGSPAPYIYDLMKISRDGTLLMITATDTAVLCGAHARACIKQYNSKPLHNELCKEAGVRILLGYTARTASQFDFGIVPLLSISDMHYMRIFIKLEKGAEKAVESAGRTGIGTFCPKCNSWQLFPGMAPLAGGSCAKCGSRLEGFGPLWTASLYDKAVVLKTSKKLGDAGIIKTISEELDTPMFYSIPKVTKRLGLSAISPYAVMDRLHKSGFRATRTQFDKDSIKTDAKSDDIMRIVKTLSTRGR